jgi:hypothetical protein
VGVRITTNIDRTFPLFIKRSEEKLYDALATAMYEVARQGAITARAYTAQRGRPTSRGSGRIDTGAMVEAINHKVELAGSKIIAEFGFTDEVAGYYIFQTVTGFTNWVSGDFIEPTFAIRDAGEKSRGEAIKAIKAAIRSVRM